MNVQSCCNVRPFMAVHPGSILKEELEARGLKIESFSNQAGISFALLEDVLDERKCVDAELAAHLENALGISAVFWVSLQNDYEKDDEVLKLRKNSKTHSLLSKLPWNKVAL